MNLGTVKQKIKSHMQSTGSPMTVKNLFANAMPALRSPSQPAGIATRPPVMANKARGTMASTVRNLIPKLRF